MYLEICRKPKLIVISCFSSPKICLAKTTMSLAVSYNKYEMFSDEEQLIYEDDDDYEGWEDNNQAITDRTNIPSPTGSQRFDNVSIGDALDNEYFQDRTLSSISTPANRIWNLATTSGYVKIVCYECQTFLFASTPYFSIFYNNTYCGTSNKKGFFVTGFIICI